MDISSKIREDHLMLSRASADFLDFVNKNPEALKQESFPSVASYDDGKGKLQMWPTFINQKTKRHLQEAGVDLLEIIKSLPRRVFNNDPVKIAQYYSIPESLALYMLTWTNESHLKFLVGRGDYIFTATGLKCVEYNVATNLGGWWLSVWQSLYLNTPIIQRFIQEYNVKVIECLHLLKALWEHLIKAGKELLVKDIDALNVALVVGKDSRFLTGNTNDKDPVKNSLFQELLKSYNMNGSIKACLVTDLEVRERGVYCQETPISIVLTLNKEGFVVPVRMRKLFDERRFIMLNGPVNYILMDKLNMALMSENQNTGIFNPAERELIGEMVPWSRRVANVKTTYQGECLDLLPLIRANRERFVLKPTNEFGGEGVCVGCYVSQERWEKVLENALGNKPWLVQEYAEPLSLVYQADEVGYALHDSVWGLFVFGNQYVDGFLRVMPRKGKDGVVNCKQGATVTKIIEVDEEIPGEKPGSWDQDLQFDFS